MVHPAKADRSSGKRTWGSWHPFFKRGMASRLDVRDFVEQTVARGSGEKVHVGVRLIDTEGGAA